MKSNNHSFTGLASSLLLNVGFTRIAEKLDPLASQSAAGKQFGGSPLANVPCMPSQFSTRRR